MVSIKALKFCISNSKDMNLKIQGRKCLNHINSELYLIILNEKLSKENFLSPRSNINFIFCTLLLHTQKWVFMIQHRSPTKSYHKEFPIALKMLKKGPNLLMIVWTRAVKDERHLRLLFLQRCLQTTTTKKQPEKKNQNQTKVTRISSLTCF